MPCRVMCTWGDCVFAGLCDGVLCVFVYQVFGEGV